MSSTVKRVKFAAATVVLAAISAVIYSALIPTPARAQRGYLVPAVQQSVGPVSLNSGESMLIGLLLPAVQHVDQAAQLQLFDSNGKLLVNIPVAMGDGSVRTAFYHATLTGGSVAGAAPAVLTITDGGGNVLATARNSDGTLIGLLLPAVQRNGQHIGALSSSAQIFDVNGNRSQYVGFCDGSVRLAEN